jgi:ribonuclease-3
MVKYLILRDESIVAEKVSRLEKITGHSFNDPKLRVQAITRKAYVNDIKPGCMPDNEVLATLGDSIIDVVIFTQLRSQFDNKGGISEEKNKFVGHKRLSDVARKIGLKDCLLLGRCEGNTLNWDQGQGLGECLESIIGAIFLDCYQSNKDGIRACEMVLRKIELIK